MLFQSKLLKKGYGFDVSGVVQDAEQDNVRDKTSPVRQPDKDQDFNTQNMVSDTVSEEEELAREKAKNYLNPQIVRDLPNSEQPQW